MSRHRRPAGKGDRKRFSRSASKTHKRNMQSPRGGFRM